MRLLIFFLPLFLFAEIIKFNNLKNSYYQNQIVLLKGKIILPNDINITPIARNVKVILKKENPYVYNITIRFQANNNPHILMLLGPNFYKEFNLNNFIKIIPLENKPKNFCGVFAKLLKIINPISSKYDNNKNILSFTIKCKECNLKDFNLSNEQNLTLLNQNEASYYILLPKNKKNLTFYYFDLNTSTFQKISIPIILKQQTISTQTDINPEEKTFFTPFNILILSIIAILLVIFLIYQRVWILIFPLMLGMYLIYTLIPKGEIILPKNTKIQILPTPQSTIIYITKKPIKAEILKKSGSYIKIKFKNKIGWVKDENFR
jgi:hypothetical protein